MLFVFGLTGEKNVIEEVRGAGGPAAGTGEPEFPHPAQQRGAYFVVAGFAVDFFTAGLSAFSGGISFPSLST